VIKSRVHTTNSLLFIIFARSFLREFCIWGVYFIQTILRAATKALWMILYCSWFNIGIANSILTSLGRGMVTYVSNNKNVPSWNDQRCEIADSGPKKHSVITALFTAFTALSNNMSLSSPHNPSAATYTIHTHASTRKPYRDQKMIRCQPLLMVSILQVRNGNDALVITFVVHG